MGKKEEYKLKNEQFLQNLRTEEGVKELAAGVLYRILESGQGSSATPRPNSIVSVHYLSLIHISEPTRQAEISYAVFCLKKKKTKKSTPAGGDGPLSEFNA